MTIRVAILVACALGALARSAECQQPDVAARIHQLKATPTTVAWGHYDAATPPVLRIKPGDAVEVHTLITNSPARLERAGVAPDQVEQALRDIHNELKNKGPGGHILTGPIYIEGAEPGDDGCLSIDRLANDGSSPKVAHEPDGEHDERAESDCGDVREIRRSAGRAGERVAQSAGERERRDPEEHLRE